MRFEPHWCFVLLLLCQGAVWHIYSANDKEKIRAFLRKEFHGCHEPIVDPIHDQVRFVAVFVINHLLLESLLHHLGWLWNVNLQLCVFLAESRVREK